MTEITGTSLKRPSQIGGWLLCPTFGSVIILGIFAQLGVEWALVAIPFLTDNPRIDLADCISSLILLGWFCFTAWLARTWVRVLRRRQTSTRGSLWWFSLSILTISGMAGYGVLLVFPELLLLGIPLFFVIWVLLNLGLFAGWVYVFLLLCNRRGRFRMAFAALSLLTAIYAILHFLAKYNFVDPEFSIRDTYHVVALVGALIFFPLCVPYVLISRRVRTTFIR